MTNETEFIRNARARYDSYSNEWKRDYFNDNNGGYLVIDKIRIVQGNLSKQEKVKYEKEYNMCLTLAQNGHKIVFLKLTEGSFDIFIDDISADLKKTAGSGNIVKYAKKATREQGAQIVVFEFEKESASVYSELEVLKKIGIHGKYYFSDKRSSIHDF